MRVVHIKEPNSMWLKGYHSQINTDLLLECFIVLWWPVVILGLGAEFAFLVGQVGAQGVDLDKRPEHGVRLPDEIIDCDHCGNTNKWCQADMVLFWFSGIPVLG